MVRPSPTDWPFRGRQGRPRMNMNFCVVDETEHELQVLCEVDQLPGRVAWRAHIYGTVSAQQELSGEAMDHDAVAGHVQAEVLDRGIFAKN